ncbi:MAG: hypothetical protein WCI48_08615 [Bacteroidota bacterium]
MEPEKKPKKSFKEKFIKEFIEYWVNVVYLALFFAVFICYKRLVLAEHGIVYTDWGFGLINALILGKVVSIGSMMKLGRWLESRALIWSTLNRSVVFTIWLALFNAVELFIRGFFNTHTFQGSLDALSHIGTSEYFGNSLVVFTSFIPFFAFKELSRVLGPKFILDLFLKGKQSAQ